MISKSLGIEVKRYIWYKNNYSPKLIKTEGMKSKLRSVENVKLYFEILV